MKLDLAVDAEQAPWQPNPSWAGRARALVAAAGPEDGILEVVLTDDATLRELNRSYREMDRPTDVLSFSYLSEGYAQHKASLLRGDRLAADFADEDAIEESGVLVGQVLISLESMLARDVRTDHSHEEELLFLVAHGLLHTLGYDHADEAQQLEMEACQEQLLDSTTARSKGGEAS